MTFLEWKYYDNTVLNWFIAIGIALISFIIFSIVKKTLIKKLEKAADTKAKWDDLLKAVAEKTNLLILFIAALFIGSLSLTLKLKVQHILNSILIITLLIQTAIWGQLVVHFILNGVMKRKMQEDASAVPAISFIGFFVKVLLWAVILLLILDNLGIDVTALVAGLGVGGVAIALASQKILEDLFSSLSIVLDKPFVHGDFIIVGDFLGTVEHIGLKTTRLRSLSGEQLVFSNSDLLHSRIRNYKRMYERRIVFKIGVTYETPLEKLKKIPDIIKNIVESQKLARFDRSHFASYGDFSLDFETVYYVQVPDYNQYMDTQQNINLALFQKFQEEGLEFAYPTQVHYVKN